jgi:hypothetical protein
MNTNKKSKIGQMILIATVGVAALTLVACKSFDTTTFRTEKAVGDAGKGAVHAWNQYIAVASNEVSQAECIKLMQEQAQIYDASRKLGATLQVVDGLRVAYKANAANTNLTALQAALEAAGNQSGAIVELVKAFMSGSPAMPAAKP